MCKKLLFSIFFIFVSFVWAKTQIRVCVPAYSNTIKSSFNRIIKDFENEYPEIKVKLEVGSWEVWQQKLQTDFFSNGNADLIYSTRGWVPSYVQGDKIEPLDNHLTKEELSQFPKSLIEASKINGKLYSLPSVTSARNLYVNLDLLKKVGKEIPATWNELKEVAKLVSKKTDAYGFGIQGKGVEMEKYFYYVLWNYGGKVLNKPVDGTKSSLNSPEALEAARFYNNLIKNGYSQPNVTSYNREDLQELFKQGKLAMMISHGVLAQEIKSEGHNINFIQTDVPSLTKGKKGFTLGVIDTISLSKNSKAKKAAIKFLMYTYRPKYQADWIAKSNLLPVTFEASKEKVFQAKNLQAMIKAVPNAKFTFIHKKSTRIIDILKNELQGIYSGQKTPKKALEAANSKINRIMR